MLCEAGRTCWAPASVRAGSLLAVPVQVEVLASVVGQEYYFCRPNKKIPLSYAFYTYSSDRPSFFVFDFLSQSVGNLKETTWRPIILCVGRAANFITIPAFRSGFMHLCSVFSNQHCWIWIFNPFFPISPQHWAPPEQNPTVHVGLISFMKWDRL